MGPLWYRVDTLRRNVGCCTETFAFLVNESRDAKGDSRCEGPHDLRPATSDVIELIAASTEDK